MASKRKVTISTNSTQYYYDDVFVEDDQPSGGKLAFIPDDDYPVPSKEEVLPPLIILICGLVSFSYGMSCTWWYFTEESYVLIPPSRKTEVPNPTDFPNYIYGPPTLALGMVLLVVGGTILIDLAEWRKILFAKITVCFVNYFRKSGFKW